MKKQTISLLSGDRPLLLRKYATAILAIPVDRSNVAEKFYI
jgi:hypothetical protein